MWTPFFEWLKMKVKGSTYEQYVLRINRFMHMQKLNSPSDIQRLRLEDIMRYITKLRERNKVVGLDVAAIKNLLTFYNMDTLANKIPSPTPSSGLVSTKWIPEKILKYMVDRYCYKPSLRALIALCYQYGLRIGEALMLNRFPEQNVPYVDLNNNVVVVYREKTRSYPWQEFKLDSWVARHLKDYLSRRNDAKKELFIGLKSGERMTIRTADSMWAEFINGIGLDSHLYHIHVLRHSCGTNLAIKGWDLVDIAKYLGHSNINMTLRYVHMARVYLLNPSTVLNDFKNTILWEDVEKGLLVP